MPHRILWLAAVTAALSTAPAYADELSPWFGGESGAAFQVSLGSMRVAAEADATQTGSVAPCKEPDCPAPPKLAKGEAGAGAP